MDKVGLKGWVLVEAIALRKSLDGNRPFSILCDYFSAYIQKKTLVQIFVPQIFHTMKLLFCVYIEKNSCAYF
jgi:hypothetical protein